MRSIFSGEPGINLPGAAREEVTLVRDGGELRIETANPEDPGPFFCMPLAGLVTASARLLLAMVDAFVAEKGSRAAAGHTDSAHIIANEMGGPIECDVRSPDIGLGGHIAGRGKTSMHALSRTEIEEICQTF